VKNVRLILLPGLLSVLLFSAAAGAMPAGEGSGQPDAAASNRDALYEQVLKTRRSAHDSYRTSRENRLQELNLGAARGVGRSDRIPGWKLRRESTSAPAEQEDETGGIYILLAVGAGVILLLVLKVFAPFLFDRRPKRPLVGEPMTIQLKPRAERHLRRT